MLIIRLFVRRWLIPKLSLPASSHHLIQYIQYIGVFAPFFFFFSPIIFTWFLSIDSSIQSCRSVSNYAFRFGQCLVSCKWKSIGGSGWSLPKSDWRASITIVLPMIPVPAPAFTQTNKKSVGPGSKSSTNPASACLPAESSRVESRS